jgi:hypothetical protein
LSLQSPISEWGKYTLNIKRVDCPIAVLYLKLNSGQDKNRKYRKMQLAGYNI